MNLKSINQKVFTQITDQQDYNASNTYFRTPSNDWIQPDYPEDDQDRELKISAQGLQGTTVPIEIHEHGTKGVFCYEEKGSLECQQVITIRIKKKS